MSNFEFYPTPSTLAIKAVHKFRSHDYKRILEPSAGRGDLLIGFDSRYERNKSKIDCIELDLNNQAILREKGYNVIDSDFMQFSGAAMYSHVILNPPFSAGVDHALKAWDLLYNGEVVCILNAETIKNPYSAKRELLVNLIEQHGSVEFIEDAFLDPDTQRKTPVEIALIHMEKKGDIQHDYFTDLQVDKGESLDYQDKQELAIKGSTISNAVIVFNTAVSMAKKAAIAQEEANYYARLLGKPLNQMNEQESVKPDNLINSFNATYDDLKKRAWTNVLNSTEFRKHLSSKAYEKLSADFEQVSKLSFTESNIRAFLIGLIQGKSEMNMQMLLDCFDEITKYHHENRAYYRGWKSNTKHKEQAYRVQMTRFILPVNGYRYDNFLDCSMKRKLADLDKVFAMLDGRYISDQKEKDDQDPYISLEFVFDNMFSLLKSGERVSTDYFDIRYYHGAGTIHFYPTNKSLIDRLNRMVGKHRQWLPQDEKQAGKEFWKQYDKAEQVTKNMQFRKLGTYERFNESDEKLMQIHLEACKKLGYDTNTLLEHAA
jgi:hypothetical protein